MAHSGGADEDEPGAQGSAVHGGAGGAAGGAGARGRLGAGVPLAAGPLALRGGDLEMVRDLGIGAVPHGFRSSFRDWAAECSNAPREVCELALAYVNTDRVEAAYQRTDMFERRAELMEQWAAFLARTPHVPRFGRQYEKSGLMASARASAMSDSDSIFPHDSHRIPSLGPTTIQASHPCSHAGQHFMREGTAAARRAGRSLAAASRAAQRANDALGPRLQDARRDVARALDVMRRRGPARDHSPSR